MKTVKGLTLVVFSLLLCVLMSGVRVNASSETVLRVEPKRSAADVGSSCEVDVTISDVFNLYGYEFKLYYDTSMLTLTDMMPHKETTDEPYFFFQEYFIWHHEINNDPGENGMGYAWLAATLPPGAKEGTDGGGILATLKFTAVNTGTTILTFDSLLHLLGDPQAVPIAHSAVQGKVTVGATGDTSSSTFVDETPPSGAIKIAGGSPYTNQASVKLTLLAYDDDSGIYQMRLSDDAVTWTEWEVYASSKDWTLTAGEGKKTVCVQYKDNVGLESPIYLDTIELDTTLPTITIDWPVQGSELKSSVTNVQWTGADTGAGIDHYEIRVDDGSWINVGNKVEYVISGLDNGGHTVEVQILDQAGNSRTASTSFTVNALFSRGPVYTDAVVGATIIAPIVGLVVCFLKFRKKT